MTKQKKSKQIDQLVEKFSKSKGVLLTEYKGLTVAELAELRRQMKEIGGEYKVVKNTLISIAAKDTPYEKANSFFTGPTGIAFGYNDVVDLTKKVLDFSNKYEKFKIKSGIIDGQLCTIEDIKAISTLPSRQTLLAILCGAFQAPISKLAILLSSTINQFAYALEALKNKKEQTGGN
ncbi:MAG: 50S ribosomal protein L10 [Thermodesulfovibrionales bacterium]|nr:50S ribosomal protein L10 [Thermodesulfovibrionales bacterium]